MACRSKIMGREGYDGSGRLVRRLGGSLGVINLLIGV